MMKGLMILLALVAGMAFAGCSDDEEQVLPKTTADQIAEEILSYGIKEATIRWGGDMGLSEEVTFEIESPFLIAQKEGEDFCTYFPLEKLLYLYYSETSNYLILYFE